jgi:hypothetical protein
VIPVVMGVIGRARRMVVAVGHRVGAFLFAHACGGRS